MSDVATDQTGAESTGAVQQTEQAEAPPLTVKEHAQLHSERRDAITPEERTKLEEKAAHHSDAQKREKDTGKFEPGKVKHRAESQKARADDVPRINALTARAKAAEDRLQAAEGELTRLRAERAPAREIQQAERTVERSEAAIADRKPVIADNDPEPVEDDPKYGGDYGKYLRDVTRWETRQALKADRVETEQRATQAKRQEAQTTTLRTFAERLTAAQTKYDDFAETLQWDAPWLASTGQPHPGYEAIHDFILTDENGPDVLQSLRSHPEEVDALLQVPPLQQVKRLTLLGQRFASPQPSAADTTGAAPRRTVITLPPKPPTPVRTEASRVVGAAPTDGSMSVMAHAKAFKR